MKFSKKCTILKLALLVAALGALPLSNIQFPLSSKNLSFLESDPYECFMILAGKKTTADGSVLLAHNNDLSGNEASLIEKHPRAQHYPSEVVSFPSGLDIPQAEETYAWMVLRIYEGFAEGDAVAINEHQVSIAGGLALGGDRNEMAVKADPLIKKGLTGGVRYIALQRSKTARECVELIGELYTRYGVTYPSGCGVADPNEIWYIESGGGRSWAAVRIPDDAVWVQANGYRIGEIDFNDKNNYLCSPNLKEFALEKGLWNPEQGPFHFARAFGQKERPPERTYYNSRRVWRGISLLNPSLELDPNAAEYPLFIKPEAKIDIQKMVSILRDHYGGTEYDIYAKGSAGSYERAIAVSTSVHTDVVQLRGWMPNEIGAVLWAGVGPSPFALYVPFYFGITEIPAPFATAGKDYDPESAFWIFRTLCDRVTPQFGHLEKLVLPEWRKFESDLFDHQKSIEETVLKLYKEENKLALDSLTDYSKQQASKSFDMARQLLKKL
jgi:dipeptidase